MKFCSNCGGELNENQNVCLKCGAITNNTYIRDTGATRDKGSVGWALLGFFIPLLGFILYLLWKNTNPNDAKQAGTGAFISFISFISGIVLYLIFVVIVVSSTMN